MNQNFGNPFVSSRLLYPVEQQQDYVRFSQTENPSPLDTAPFPRRVDMWFAAFSFAARRGMPPTDLSGHQTIPFVEGDTFNQDPWRIRLLMLVAIAIDKSIHVINDPARMMVIANGLAAAGAPMVVEMLSKGSDQPIWNLSESLETLLQNNHFETEGESEDVRS